MQSSADHDEQDWQLFNISGFDVALCILWYKKYCMYARIFIKLRLPVPPVAQRYHLTSDTLGREFDPGKRDFSH